LIDQKRAHERILFEKYMEETVEHKVAGQKNLFPEVWELSVSDFLLVGELLPDLEYLGFELDPFGKDCYAIQAIPPDLSGSRAKEVLTGLLEHYKSTEGNIREKVRERVVLALAKAAAIGYNTSLTCEEMSEMTDRLFACKHQNFTADGKTIIHILKYEDVNSWFK
ncbi:MAG: DNA mismatch repair protein MutL, partial [Odoribacter sp.]|nr:DNA mismatch repair protein MutL [Odoribacter sp.]